MTTNRWPLLLKSRVFSITAGTIAAVILKKTFQIELTTEETVVIGGCIGAVLIYLINKDRTESRERIAAVLKEKDQVQP